MRIALGLDWTGRTLSRFDDHSIESGAIGEVTWGPAELLGDLELRLGLGASVEPEAVRVAKWAERIAAFAIDERLGRGDLVQVHQDCQGGHVVKNFFDWPVCVH